MIRKLLVLSLIVFSLCSQSFASDYEFLNPSGFTPIGSSNQVLGINSAGTAFEYKTLSGTSNQVSVTHGVGTITLAVPQNIHTGASPTFAGLTLSSPLTVANGGTGVNTFTAGYLLFGNTASPIATDSNLFWNNTSKLLSLGGVQNVAKTLEAQSTSAGSVIYAFSNAASGNNYAIDAYASGASTLNVAGIFAATGATTNYGIRIALPASGASNYAIYSDATAQSYFAGSISTPTLIAPNIAPAANFTLTQNAVVPFTSVNTGAVANTLYLNAGNVGIGTAGPDHTLTLVSGTAADWAMKIRNTTANGISGFGYYDNSDTWKGVVGYDNADANFLKLYGTTSVGIKFYTNTVEAMRINSSGNVGIGTVSPDEKFEIEWSANVDVEIGQGTTDTDVTFIALRSPNGTKYYVTVTDGGAIAVSGTKP